MVVEKCFYVLLSHEAARTLIVVLKRTNPQQVFFVGCHFKYSGYLGGYASWVSSANEGRDLGRACVRAAGAALQRCPPAAALALRKLASDCSAPAAALAPEIVQAAQVTNSANIRKRLECIQLELVEICNKSGFFLIYVNSINVIKSPSGRWREHMFLYN